MKIFISWSGEKSRAVAELLQDWLKCVIQACEPWASSKNIESGTIWFAEISKILGDVTSGIVCLTEENKSKPWIHFEAGAIAKGITETKVYTFLIDLEHKDIEQPLASFNHTMPEKVSMKKLINSINSDLKSGKLEPGILNEVFDTYWGKFKSKFDEILETFKDEKPKQKRDQNSMLEEILYSVRGMDKRISSLEYLNCKKSLESYFSNYLRSSKIQDITKEKEFFEILYSNSKKEILNKLLISYLVNNNEKEPDSGELPEKED